MATPSSVNAPVAVTVNVSPMPEPTAVYVPVMVAVLAAKTATAGFTPATALLTAVSTYSVVAALVEPSSWACVVAVVPLAYAVLKDQVPDDNCAMPVEELLFSPVPP